MGGEIAPSPGATSHSLTKSSTPLRCHPYNNSKVEKPVEAWGTSFTEKCKKGSQTCKSFPFSCTNLRRIHLSLTLNRSTNLLVWRWYADIHRDWTPVRRHMAFNILLMKAANWSVTTCSLNPTWLKRVANSLHHVSLDVLQGHGFWVIYHFLSFIFIIYSLS